MSGRKPDVEFLHTQVYRWSSHTEAAAAIAAAAAAMAAALPV
jgi:hypothetical protein